MNKVLSMTYASSLTNLCEVNSSFDSGILRIAYPGENRNHSSISKATFERCIKTMFNCPIVCHYDRETDTIGGHDMELVKDKDGSLRIVNLTTPIGCIPESAKYWWDTVEEDDGTLHEYLFAEALIWKRQDAYKRIKENGITAHSMEINVKDGAYQDGVYHIYDFEFTAFALIGVTPCFESSSLEIYSKENFTHQLSEMMRDLKNNFNTVNASDEVDDIQQTDSLKGGEEVLNEKTQMAEKYGIDVKELDFSIDDFSVDELVEKFKAIKASAVQGCDKTNSGNEDNQKDENKFALTGNITNELNRMLSDAKIEREWGTCPRYSYVDCNFERFEVYCFDVEDWLLYGFTYSINGDCITIDFDSKKRMKFEIEDFEEGSDNSQESPFASAYSEVAEKYHDAIQFEAKFNEATASLEALENELSELRSYKQNSENEKRIAKENELLERFRDLEGVEEFDRLFENKRDYEIDVLEEKCYAIRGKKESVSRFALESKSPKFKVVKAETSKEPYGGLFIKYGIESN